LEVGVVCSELEEEEEEGRKEGRKREDVFFG
jgi:hypothetical protein